MPTSKEIPINRFQLSRLLSPNQQAIFDQVLAASVFCVKCGTCEKGIRVKEIFLDSQDDLRVSGVCNICHHSVCRIIEFREDVDFRRRAKKFRDSLI